MRVPAGRGRGASSCGRPRGQVQLARRYGATLTDMNRCCGPRPWAPDPPSENGWGFLAAILVLALLTMLWTALCG